MGRSHDIATSTHGDTRYVNTSGDTITGDTVISTTTQNQLRIENTAANSLGSYMKIRDGNSTAGQHTWIGRSTNDTYIYSNNNDLGMKIKNAGQVNMPNQPTFAAYGYSGTTTAVGVYYNPILWGNVHGNYGNNWNNSTGRFTFPVDGKYLAFCNINLKATDSEWFGLHLLYNNSVQRVSWSQNLVNSQYINVVMSSIVTATANDTLGFFWHNTYSAPEVNASYNMAYIHLLA